MSLGQWWIGEIESDPSFSSNISGSHLSAQCPVYFHLQPDDLNLYVEATDPFLQDWSQVQGYANPLWSLIG